MIHFKRIQGNLNILNNIAAAISMLILLISLYSCGNDDDSTENDAIMVADTITFTIEENASLGELIGTIQASSSSPITYSIISQDYPNALALNPISAEITVGDVAFYDFEDNPSIGALVEVSNGAEILTVNLIVNLIDIDDIAFTLDQSKDDYLSAQSGDWVEITQSEYTALAQRLNEVTRSGFLEEGATFSPSMNGVFTLTNLDDSTRSSNLMSASSLVFAFRYFAVDNTVNSDPHRVKQSSATPSTGFQNIGNALPPHNSINSVACFVLKGSDTMITSDQGFLGFQKSSGSSMVIAQTQGIMLFGLGETSEMNAESNGNSAMYEGLSTTQRQWD